MSTKLQNSNNTKHEYEFSRVLQFIRNANEAGLTALEAYMDKNSEEILTIGEEIGGKTKDQLNASRVPNKFFAQLKVLLNTVQSKKNSDEDRSELSDLLYLHRMQDEFRFISFLFNFVNKYRRYRMKGGTATRKSPKKTVRINGGHNFHIEDPSKNWTLTNRYKKWVSKLTRKSTGKRHTKAEDLCVGKDNICEGDLGIPRKYMPQFIGKDDVHKFRNFIKRVYGIKSRITRRKAKELRPTQKEISRSRIEDLIENEKILTKVLVPLVISRDNYVVDGHHRWAAYRLKKPNKDLPVVEIDVPIKDVLGISIAWGAKHQDF